MEQGINPGKAAGLNLDLIKACFNMEVRKGERYSPLMLAYIGDAVYELIIRSALLKFGDSGTKATNRRAIKYVSAVSQARMIEGLMDLLTEQEQAIYRRGRNANFGTRSKNASMIDYRKATGFEALMGYLYIEGQEQRAVELARAGIRIIDEGDIYKGEEKNG